jgi:hypothetical protein
MGFKGMHFTCPTCGLKQPVTKKNIVIHLFTKQPMYNTVEFFCKCGEQYQIFGLNDYIMTANLRNRTVITNEYVDEATMRGYAKLFFHDTLSDTEESMVKYFSEILSSTEGVDQIDWREHG